MERNGPLSQTIVITGARAPAALHLARLFHAAGHRMVLADTFRRPLAAATRFKQAYVQLPAPRDGMPAFVAALKELVARETPDLVIPACEEVFFLAAARDKYGVPLPLFAPHFDVLARVHNKADFAQLAIGFGADPPETVRLQSRGDVEALTLPRSQLVLKPAWSRFGSRVLVQPSQYQLDQVRPSLADPWVAQAYLPGDEICAYAVARDGRLLAFRAYRPTYRAGAGAGVAFEPVDNAAARQFTEGLVTSLGWTGQISFDFRHDRQGRLRVIECNPRSTSGLHYFNAGDGLPEAILNGAGAVPSGSGPMTLPFAMLAYGLPYSLGHHGVGRWLTDFRSMQDITSWPGERSMALAQISAFLEIAGRAVRKRTGLIDASVRDIQWDGEPLI